MLFLSPSRVRNCFSSEFQKMLYVFSYFFFRSLSIAAFLARELFILKNMTPAMSGCTAIRCAKSWASEFSSIAYRAIATARATRKSRLTSSEGISDMAVCVIVETPNVKWIELLTCILELDAAYPHRIVCNLLIDINIALDIGSRVR